MAEHSTWPDGAAVAGARLEAAQNRCDEKIAAARARRNSEVTIANEESASAFAEIKALKHWRGSKDAGSAELARARRRNEDAWARAADAMEEYATALSAAAEGVRSTVADIEQTPSLARHSSLARELENTHEQLANLEAQIKEVRREAPAVRRGEAGLRKAGRRPIPTSVRREVWRRDEGRCVDCGSRERLEYDHIVPVSKGGSNTARNIELRCESCNRRKGATI